MIAVSSPAREADQAAVTIALIWAVGLAALVRMRRMGVYRTPEGLRARELFRTVALRDECEYVIRRDRVGLERIFAIPPQGAPRALPLLVHVGRPRYPSLHLYPFANVLQRRTAPEPWVNLGFGWGDRSMLDELGHRARRALAASVLARCSGSRHVQDG